MNASIASARAASSGARRMEDSSGTQGAAVVFGVRGGMPEG